MAAVKWSQNRHICLDPSCSQAIWLGPQQIAQGSLQKDMYSGKAHGSSQLVHRDAVSRLSSLPILHTMQKDWNMQQALSYGLHLFCMVCNRIEKETLRLQRS